VKELGVKALEVFSDSQIVVQQVNGEYEAREPSLQRYLEAVKLLITGFERFTLTQVPREENSKADALSKLASSELRPEPGQKLLMEMLTKKSYEEERVASVEQVAPEDSWILPIKAYLAEGITPVDRVAARKVRVKAPRYTLVNGALYKRGHLQPLLKCVEIQEGKQLIREVHEGPNGSHQGARTVARKILQLGYYWPTLFKDAQDYTQACLQCQRFAPIVHIPQEEMVGITGSWPFHRWGIDLVGPFPVAPGGVKYLIVAIDYFSKWVEAEALTNIRGATCVKFCWKNIICRYGIPKIIVTDNGAQFENDPFKSWCTKYGIEQKVTSVYHPQPNGQVEVTNRTIVNGIKTRLEGAKGNWIWELPSVLWAHRTTESSATGESPYNLVYGSEAVIPAEVGVPTLRTLTPRPDGDEEQRRLDLDLLEEKREQASLHEAKVKERVKRYHDRRVRKEQFSPGDRVMRRNDRSHQEKEGKLAPNWEGPYKVVEAHPGGSYVLQGSDGKQVPRRWNIANLRRFYG
jgi:hypothetical protein